MYSIAFICKCINKFSKVRNLIPSFGYFIPVFVHCSPSAFLWAVAYYLYVLTSWEFVVSPLSLALSLLLWKLVKALAKPCWPCCFLLLRTICTPFLYNTNSLLLTFTYTGSPTYTGPPTLTVSTTMTVLPSPTSLSSSTTEGCLFSKS